MGILYQKLDIRTSELTTIRVHVAAWESPVLQAVHGDDVSFVSEAVIDHKNAPEAGDEFARLAIRYKAETDDSPPPVAAVYGQFGPGIAALQKSIEAATQDIGVERVSDEEAAQINQAIGSEPAAPSLEGEAKGLI